MNSTSVTGRQLTAAGLLAAVACGGLITTRKLFSGKHSTTEQLTEALLNASALTTPGCIPEDESFTLMSACISYIIAVTTQTSLRSTVVNANADFAGDSRNLSHPYTHARVEMMTLSIDPELKLAYTVHIPNIGEVRGTRNFGGKQLSGLSLMQVVRDFCQFNFKVGHSIQMESDLLVAYLGRLGGSQLHGSLVVRDESGNNARLHISSNGSLSGALTAHSHVIGRFEGDTKNGLRLKKYSTK